MSRRGRPRYPDILTPREAEVLELICGGLSNPEIADRLGIGREGVRYHVSEILSKLGVSSREEAAQWRTERERPRWLRAAAPLFFWRRLIASKLSTALAAGLFVGIAAGIGLLAWALLITRGGASFRVVALAAGGSHTCALTNKGGVRCWGANDFGQLGDGTTTDRTTPVEVVGLSRGVIAIAAGGLQEIGHTCALMNNGGVKCWGYNVFGQLGDGRVCGLVCPTPVDVIGLVAGVTAIAAGSEHACASLVGGTVKCWGSNEFGQLGNDTVAGTKCYNSVCILAPVDVTGLTAKVASISAGGSGTCALTASGGLTCWGNDRATPEDVLGLTGRVTAVAVGGNQACSVTTSGSLKCWNGNTVAVEAIADISGLDSGAVAIATSEEHTCAITKEGGLKCWGSNGSGQLGNGTKASSTTPVDVAGLTNDVAAVSAGSDYTCALTKAGEIRCWGLNNRSELGNGGDLDRNSCGPSTPCSATPVEVRVFATPGPTATVPMYSGHPLDFVARNLDDAIFFADIFARGCPPTCLFYPDSLSYVETTIGKARELTDPQRTDLNWAVPESFRCWVLVYYGQFADLNRFTGKFSPFSTFIAVVPEGARGITSRQGNQRYDLSKLGDVKQIPGPLPTFGRLSDLRPTPVP